MRSKIDLLGTPCAWFSLGDSLNGCNSVSDQHLVGGQEWKIGGQKVGLTPRLFLQNPPNSGQRSSEALSA
eukprot:1160842-Pelagomonas_calceolata.AAC.9